jgi:hypothetical protein
MGLAQLRRATNAEQIREWSKLIQVLTRVGPPALVALLATGIYLAATVWRDAPWLEVRLDRRSPGQGVALRW